MPEFFAIFAAIFSIISVVFGVRNRINSTRTGAGSGIRNDRSRYNDLVSDNKRLERDKERVEELDKRDDESIRRCSRIGERIRKREQEADTTK